MGGQGMAGTIGLAFDAIGNALAITGFVVTTVGILGVLYALAVYA